MIKIMKPSCTVLQVLKFYLHSRNAKIRFHVNLGLVAMSLKIIKTVTDNLAKNKDCAAMNNNNRRKRLKISVVLSCNLSIRVCGKMF